MICRTYTPRETVVHMAYIVFLTVCGALTAFSAGFAFTHIACSEDIIAACFTTSFSLLILSVDFFECRAMGARLYMDERGIAFQRFGKTKVFIPWEDVQDVGRGRMPTAFGSKELVYFCDHKLSEEEKHDLIILKHHTVNLYHIPKDWYAKLCEWLPSPLTGEIRTLPVC